MIDPILAGELLADYMAARGACLTNNVKARIAGDAQTFDAMFETLWEMQFWRTACLYGLGEVRAEITRMKAKGQQL